MNLIKRIANLGIIYLIIVFVFGCFSIVPFRLIDLTGAVYAHTVAADANGNCPPGHHLGNGPPVGPIPCVDDSTSTSGADLGLIHIKFPSLGQLVNSLLLVAFSIAGIFFLIQIVLGGIMWIGAGGDQKSLDAARSRITNAVIGLIIVAASVAIATIVTSALGINIFSGAEIKIGG